MARARAERSHGPRYGDSSSVRVAYVEALDEVEAEREGELRAEGHPLTRHSAVGLGLEHTRVPELINVDIEHRWVPSEHRINDSTLAIGASARSSSRAPLLSLG